MTTALAIVLVVMLVVAAVGLAIPLVRRYDAAAREGETIAAVIRGQLDEVDAQAASGQIGGDAAGGAADRAQAPAARRGARAAGRRAAAVGPRGGAARADRRDGRRARRHRALRRRRAARPRAPGARSPPRSPRRPAPRRRPADPGIADLIPPARGARGGDPRRRDRVADAGDGLFRGAALRRRGRGLRQGGQAAAARRRAAVGAGRGAGAGGGRQSSPPAAAAAFTAARGLDPADARARYFLALARDQRGDHKGAVDDWVALLNSAPADAPWAAQLRGFVEQAAKQAGISLAGRLKAPTARRSEPPVLAGAANARGPDASPGRGGRRHERRGPRRRSSRAWSTTSRPSSPPTRATPTAGSG